MRRLVFVLVQMFLASSAAASSFTVKPVRVNLSENNASALLNIMNESDGELRFQMHVYTWTQSEIGEIKLAPTKDIVFFPTVLTVEAHGTRNVRVGSNVAADATEKTYRIFVHELPASNASSASNALQILTEMGIPIFLQRGKGEPKGKLDAVAIEKGQLHFTVQNIGTAHLLLQTVHVDAFDRDGASVIKRDLPAWYILADGVRRYSMPLAGNECSKVHHVVITASSESQEIHSQLEVHVPHCPPNAPHP